MNNPIKSQQDLERFVGKLIADGINFHPDTPFEEYVNEARVRVYDDWEAWVLNCRMAEAFERFGETVYDTSLRIIRKRLQA